jgi:RND family efflux transporter MFP subunit
MPGRTLAALLPLLAALALQACSSGAEAGETPQQGPMPVTVATPLQQEVVDWDDYVGRFEAVQTVDVRPRATGYLQAVHFRDGDYVRQGQLLFTIDARPAQAQLDQARAQLARAQAALANARTELARSRTLAASRAASLEEVEQRQAAVRTAIADVAAANAAIRAQQLNVGFTRVFAPISGRISERRVDPGNSVTADQTVLTTIVSTDPLHFTFEGSEAALLKYQRQGGGGARAGTAVRIRLQDEADYVHAGTLDFVDAVLNPSAGTIRARAIVPNRDGLLRPGMVGRLRLAAAAPYRGLLVPDTAIGTDATRRVVYAVDGEGNVTPRPVELGPRLGDLRVIRSGIGPDERIIINGLQRVMPGQKVQPNMGRITPGGQAEPRAAPAQPVPSSVATPAAGQ